MSEGHTDRDLYTAIGKLTEAAENNLRSREALHAKVDQMANSIHVMQSEFNELKGSVNNVCSRVKEMHPSVEDWKRMKQRGIGLLLGAGAAGSGATIALKELWKAIT